MSQQVQLETSEGTIRIELDAERAPLSAQNFLDYVRSGHYDNTVFHRVIPGFMVQGGGFEPGMKQKPTQAPIANEARNGLKNETTPNFGQPCASAHHIAWRECCDHVVSIPMTGSASSLNASNAATVVLYEAARQRIAAGRRAR